MLIAYEDSYDKLKKNLVCIATFHRRLILFLGGGLRAVQITSKQAAIKLVCS